MPQHTFESGERLLSIFVDIREISASLPHRFRQPYDVMVHVMACLAALDYPLIYPEYHGRVSRYRNPYPELAALMQCHIQELFTVIRTGLARGQYAGEEILVSIHDEGTIVLSYRKTHTGKLEF